MGFATSRRRFLAGITGGAASVALPAWSGEGPGWAAALETLRAEHGLPALAGLVLHADGRFERAVTGRGRRDADEPASLEARWHLGSNTKAMTGLLAARLVERGVIGWGTTLEDVFPELADRFRPAWRTTTLEALLGMQAGAVEDVRALEAWPAFWRNDRPLSELRLALLREVATTDPARPGTFVYSNASYVMAGAMLERRGGQAWEGLLRTGLFEPLGLSSAGFGAPAAAAGQPWGHRGTPLPDGTGAVPVSPGDPQADNPPALGPAGTAHMGLADYGRFLRAVIAGARGEGNVLKPETWTRVLTPGPGGYALGWGVLRRDWDGGRPLLVHSGSNTLWLCQAVVAPGLGLGAAVFTNAAGGPAERAVSAAIGALLRTAREAKGPA